MAAQLQFLNPVEFILPDENGKKAKKLKTKRVHYKNPTYRKIYKQYSEESVNVSDYQKLDDIYSQIYNFCDVGIFEKFETKTQSGLRLWCDTYTKEPYEYEGAIYKGQEFKVFGAEIIGTENLPHKQRVIIHLKLLRLLRNGFSINEAFERITR